MVTSAWYVAIRRPGGSDQRRIDIHRVTKDWNSKTVTWDNKPSYDPKVADYIAFSGSGLTRLVFDITGVVKDWYADGKNYGMGRKKVRITNTFHLMTIWMIMRPHVPRS